MKKRREGNERNRELETLSSTLPPEKPGTKEKKTLPAEQAQFGGQ